MTASPGQAGSVEFEFDGTLIEWRGPAPFHFVALSEPVAEVIETHKQALTYGWGCIPVSVRIGATTFTTSLFPRHGGFLVPVKDDVRRAEGIGLGDEVHVVLTTNQPQG